MYQSIEAGRRVVLDRVGIFADGVAVQEVGRLTFPIVQSNVREIVRVSNDEICAAIKDDLRRHADDHGAGRARSPSPGCAPGSRRPAARTSGSPRS